MKIFKFIFLLIICFCLAGCVNKFGHNKKNNILVYKSCYTSNAVEIDGKLNDEVWITTPSYSMYISKDDERKGQILQEAGIVKFAWNKAYFYVAVDFNDTDIVAQGFKDNIHHYAYGDVCELFLKPALENYYWELYVTPAGKKSSFFYPSRGYLGLPGCLENYSCDLKVAAMCVGTLNNWHDRDKGWIAEMAMPIKDIEAYGCKIGPDGSRWKVLIGRYNYSIYLDTKELTMTPRLSRTFYHLNEEYAEIEFVK